MKLLAAVILICVTVVIVASEHAWKDYVLQKQKLDIEQQQLQLDILRYIQAQQDRAEHEREERSPTIPIPQKPSLDISPLTFPVPDAADANQASLETASDRSAGPPRFLAANPACLPAGENFRYA